MQWSGSYGSWGWTGYQRALDLTATDLWLLREWRPCFATVDELISLLSARHADGRLVIGDELYAMIEKIAIADVSFFTLAAHFGIAKAL
jgi:hypothetical protein